MVSLLLLFALDGKFHAMVCEFAVAADGYERDGCKAVQGLSSEKLPAARIGFGYLGDLKSV